MEFTIPQFIEREAKIVGPLTFKQFVYLLIGGGISLFLFFATPLPVFIFGLIFFVGWAAALAFLKINGAPLPSVIKNLMVFIFRPKVYLWHKKIAPPQYYQVRSEESAFAKTSADKEKEKPVLKIADKSRLRQLNTRIETKI